MVLVVVVYLVASTPCVLRVVVVVVVVVVVYLVASTPCVLRVVVVVVVLVVVIVVVVVYLAAAPRVLARPWSALVSYSRGGN